MAVTKPRAIVARLQEADRFVAIMKGKAQESIFIKWSQNQHCSKTILPYSERARTDAPAAVPIDWHAFIDMTADRPFSIDNAGTLAKRVKTVTEWKRATQSLPVI